MTEMTEKLPDKVKEEYITQIPLGRAGTPLDVANVVDFLISPAASYITGIVISVSGGMVM
jgi:3-oxoacyl-[acyl-carrier protein] reductase